MRMTFTEGTIEILVQDDGAGFQPATPAEGNGLANMKLRLANIGGECVISSEPGKGTTVRIQLQLRPSEKNA